ncbi:zinc finger CCCH domain-containing protein 39-like [Coffea arabica]|uniref:Zinc finger CCCH domain-containing protein 39-like n=1 Tax=Coffea arabica TaxID=13443 RepID=A0ABM4U6A8_COFAR
MMNSSSRMSISSTSRSNLARPINAKSESCLQHKRGHCNYGADCIFSHDMPEDQYRLMNRARLCRFFMNGKNCPYGNRCHFLHQSVKHVKGGSGVAREKAAVTVVNSGPEEGVRKESDRLACKRKAVFWKTGLCNNWDRNGSCPYGVRCQYAHGERELGKPSSFCPLESGKSFIVENLAFDREDAASTRKAIRTDCTLQEKSKSKSKSFFVKRDKVKKISGIYADWIESMPPVHLTSANL